MDLSDIVSNTFFFFFYQRSIGSWTSNLVSAVDQPTFPPVFCETIVIKDASSTEGFTQYTTVVAR